MFHAKVHFDLERECVLSEVTAISNDPFTVSHEEVLDDETVAFVIHTGEYTDSFEGKLRSSPQVKAVERLDDSRLLVTKRSCGALPIIRSNHGMIQGMDKVNGRTRVFDLVVFSRDDLRNIIEGLRDIGSVRVAKLSPYDDWLGTLSSRQAEVIQLALESGYYEWPRTVDGQTLAATLDISHATFHEHLRKAERKLLTEALSRGAPRELTAPTDRDYANRSI